LIDMLMCFNNWKRCFNNENMHFIGCFSKC